MKTPVVFILPWLIAPLTATAQGSVNLQMTNGSEVVLSAYSVDTMLSSPTEQRVLISVPKAESTTFSYAPMIHESEVNLSRADQPQSDNVLLSVSFLKQHNSFLQQDIVLNALEKKSLKAVVPYATDFSSVVPDFKASASFIYVNGTKWNSGDKVNLSSPAEVKLVAFNGDVRTYTLQLLAAVNPVIYIQTKQDVDKDWQAESTMKIGSTDFGVMSIKGAGKHYSDGLKNSYRIKFESKKSLLDMTKNKRWALVSLDGDRSLIRAALAYNLAASMSGLSWTPNYKRVELVLNGCYMGNYLLVEQVRVCKGRIEDGYAISIQDSFEEGEDYFYGAKSQSLFVMKDPETGLSGAGLLRSRDKINLFEEKLFSGADFSSLVDMQSFVDYYLINEIAKDDDAFVSDCYMNLREDGKLVMGPVWNLGKSFGYSGVSTKGFIASRSPWFAELRKNSNFNSMIEKRFAELYANKEQLLKTMDDWATTVSLSVAGNDLVWNSIDAQSNEVTDVQSVYQEEISTMKQWLEKRLDWMKSQFE
ncbi:MAG: CotH kinase family protein [Paludibacteraceae bacterium]|nr:CotH kinase family protein [Paludibacteraceae bacterium]